MFIIYILTFALFSFGVFLLLVATNYFKKLIALGLMQSAIIIFFLEVGYINGAKAPFIPASTQGLIVNPLPHVLMLTAIVVGIAILALGLAIVIKFKQKFGNIDC